MREQFTYNAFDGSFDIRCITVFLICTLFNIVLYLNIHELIFDPRKKSLYIHLVDPCNNSCRNYLGGCELVSICYIGGPPCYFTLFV